MATDLERLVVQLSADIKGYENALRRAQGVTNTQTRRIQSQFDRMNRGISAGMARLGAVLASGVAIRGAQRLIDTATRIDNALKVAGLSGQELERVYGRLFDSATRNAAPLESLVELYGRAALVQKELGISTEELLGFTDKIAVALRVSGQSASESRGALLQLSQALGSGVVRAEEFNSILEGALPIAQAAAAGLKEAGGSVARLRQLVVDGAISSEVFFRAFEAGAPILEQKVAGATFTLGNRLENLQNELINAARDFNESAKAGETFGAAIDGVARLVNSINFDNLITQIQGVVNALGAGASAIQEFYEWLGQLSGLENIGGALLGTGQRSFLGGALTITAPAGIQNRIDRAFGDAVETAGDLTEQAIRDSYSRVGRGPETTAKTGRLPAVPIVTPISSADFDPPAAKGGGGRGGGGRSATAAARREEAAALREAAKAAKELEQAQREAEQAAHDLGSALGDAVGGFVNALSDGKLELEEILGIVAQLAQQFLQLNGGGGFAGGFLSSLLGGVFHEGGVVGQGGKTRRVPAAAFVGAPRYHSGGVAGFRPGEVPAILQRGEIVIPRGQARSIGGGSSIVINAPINAPGADAAQLRRVQQSVEELGRKVPKMVDQRNDARQTRKVRA